MASDCFQAYNRKSGNGAIRLADENVTYMTKVLLAQVTTHLLIETHVGGKNN